MSDIRFLFCFLCLGFISFSTSFAESVGVGEVEPHFNAGFPGLQERLYITEVCIIPPPDSDWPVWVEIWNNTGQRIDLSGYTLETLQQRLEPFGKEFVLEPDERCLVMAYKGDKHSDSFESRLPDGTKTVRIMNNVLFPPYLSMDEWYAMLEKYLTEEEKQKELTYEEIVSKVSSLFGTTIYLNEIGIRNLFGELVAFVNWGRYTGNFAVSKTSLEAHDLRIRTKYNHNVFIRSSPFECAVLQMFHHGVYRLLWNAEHTSTPGAPLLRKPSVPIFRLPVRPVFSEGEIYGTVITLEFTIDNQYVNPDLENFWGWARSGIVAEFFYDPELTQPVFDSTITLGRRQTFSIKPLDIFLLADKQLYVRLVKPHITQQPVYSETHEIRFSWNGIGRKIYPLKQEVKRPTVNYIESPEVVEKVARYLEQCNAAWIKYQEDTRTSTGRLFYNILDVGREVVVRFSYRDNMDNLSPIAGLPVKKLDVSKSKVECIDALKNMSLTELNLSRTPVKDIEVLRGMPLEMLDISSTEVTDISPLVGAPLRWLSLEFTKVANPDVFFNENTLKNMSLKELNLQGTPVKDIEFLRGAPLEVLDISRTAVTDVSPLVGMPLRRLSLDPAKVKNLDVLFNEEALKSMPLKELVLRGGLVKDIEFLRGVPIETLDILTTRVTDVSPLVGTPLRRLIVDLRKVKNIDVLLSDNIETREKTVGVTKTIDFIRKNEEIHDDTNP